MRSLPRHVCQNENEIFCRSTSDVYVCGWESQREGSVESRKARGGPGAKRCVPQRYSNLFQFTFILNRELGCNQSPLFTRFLDTFVSFHLRHGTPSRTLGYIERELLYIYFYLLKLLNRQNCVQPLSTLLKSENTVVRHFYTTEDFLARRRYIYAFSFEEFLTILKKYFGKRIIQVIQ